jgi:hypothetical protein
VRFPSNGGTVTFLNQEFGTGFLIIFAAANGANYRMAGETGSSKWFSRESN